MAATDAETVRKEFSDAVNMTASELERWLERDESKDRRAEGRRRGVDRPRDGPPASSTWRAVALLPHELGARPAQEVTRGRGAYGSSAANTAAVATREWPAPRLARSVIRAAAGESAGAQIRPAVRTSRSAPAKP